MPWLENLLDRVSEAESNPASDDRDCLDLPRMDVARVRGTARFDLEASPKDFGRCRQERDSLATDRIDDYVPDPEWMLHTLNYVARLRQDH